MSFSAPKLALCIRRSEGSLVIDQNDPIGHLSKMPSYFIDRRWCETALNFVQILPYIVVKNTAGEVLTYRRPPTITGEKRLEGKLSLGLGGHMDNMVSYANCLGDLRTFIYREGARELQEEIGLDYTTGLGLLASVQKWSALYEPKHESPIEQRHLLPNVSYFHLGLVGVVTLPPNAEDKLDLVFEKSELFDVRWEYPDAVRQDSEAVLQYEDWSQQVLMEKLYK